MNVLFQTVLRAVWACIFLVLAVTPGMAATSGAAAKKPGAAATFAPVLLFNAPERPADADPHWLKVYAPHWQRVLHVERTESGIRPDGAGMNKADAAQWRAMLDLARQSDWTQKLRLVNGFFNGWPPTQDADTWGKPEYWDTPAEFIRLRGGDCEDYAIAKYFTLRYLGIPPEFMRIVVLRICDEKGKPNPQLHAVLAVRARDNWFILDRNVRPRDAIIPHDHYKGRFVPLYSCNETNAWKHLPDPGAPPKKPQP